MFHLELVFLLPIKYKMYLDVDIIDIGNVDIIDI